MPITVKPLRSPVFPPRIANFVLCFVFPLFFFHVLICVSNSLFLSIWSWLKFLCLYVFGSVYVCLSVSLPSFLPPSLSLSSPNTRPPLPSLPLTFSHAGIRMHTLSPLHPQLTLSTRQHLHKPDAADEDKGATPVLLSRRGRRQVAGPGCDRE